MPAECACHSFGEQLRTAVSTAVAPRDIPVRWGRIRADRGRDRDLYFGASDTWTRDLAV